MEGWSEGQLSLFEALGRVCERFGGQTAADLAKSIDIASDGKTYLKELEYLRTRSALVDELGRENDRLRRELESKTREVEALRQEKIVSKTRNTVSISDETSSSSNGDRREISYDELFAKHQVVKSNLHALKIARQVLEEELRKTKRNVKPWMLYGDGLEKKNKKLLQLLEVHGIATDDPLKIQNRPQCTPKLASSSPSRLTEEIRSSRPTSTFAISHDQFDLDSEIVVEMPTVEPVRKPSNQNHEPTTAASRTAFKHRNMTSSTDQLVDQSYDEMSSRDDFLGSNTEAEITHVLSPKAVTDLNRLNGTSMSQNNLNQLHLSQPIPSSSTQSAPDMSSHSTPGSHFEHSDVHIKDESQDTPVVVSCRAVKKNRTGMGSSLIPDKPRVKVEILSSSPIGLAGFLDRHDSLDLDDIGEKVDTPKRKRQISTKRSISNISRSRRNPESSSSHPVGNLSALRAADTNLKLTPRTNGVHKRRRVDESGASLLAEDGEDDIDSERAQNPTPQALNTAAKLSKQLCSLLEVSTPESPHLTPRSKHLGRISNLSTTEFRPATSSEMLHDNDSFMGDKQSVPLPAPHERHSRPSSATVSKSRIVKSWTETPKGAIKVRDVLNTADEKGSIRFPAAPIKATPRKMATKTTVNRKDQYHSRVPSRSVSVEMDDPDDEPLRARPIRKLGLEHFKVNRDYNQGYDYAFSDVVRGREQRKCLPGCTKPECCGGTWRKLAELRTWEQGVPTSSQEDRNNRLLIEYLGDNANQLQTMAEGQRQELLLQATTREMANTFSKHRHAYERRKSPPGFWRTDFPTTQEQERDRAEAAKCEREIVKKRYEEAMRPGGAWMFRDE